MSWRLAGRRFVTLFIAMAVICNVAAYAKVRRNSDDLTFASTNSTNVLVLIASDRNEGTSTVLKRAESTVLPFLFSGGDSLMHHRLHYVARLVPWSGVTIMALLLVGTIELKI